MKIIRAKNYDDMSRKAANIISAQVILKPDSVLGLATGSSPPGCPHRGKKRMYKISFASKKILLTSVFQ